MRAAPAPLRRAILWAARSAPGARRLAAAQHGPQWADATLADGVRLRLDLSQSAQNAMYYGLYEPAERKLIVDLLAAGDTFFDIGAHIGYLTLAGAMKVGPSGAVHAFEPSPANYNQLLENVRLNGAENVRVNQAAVSDQVGTTTLFLPAAGADGRSPELPEVSVLPSIMARAIDEAVQGIEVPVTSLDAYCAQHAIERVSLVKLDVEGAEVPAIAGMAGLLRSQHPPRVIAEVSAYRLARMGFAVDATHAALAACGYTSHRITDGGLVAQSGPSSVDATSENFLFLPPGDQLLH